MTEDSVIQMTLLVAFFFKSRLI